jgi:hypothetical protein
MKTHIENFADYHDIEDKVYNQRPKKGQPKYKGYEIDPEDFGYEFNDLYTGCLRYFAIFYIGVRPSKKEIKGFLDRHLKGNTFWRKEKGKK